MTTEQRLRRYLRVAVAAPCLLCGCVAAPAPASPTNPPISPTVSEAKQTATSAATPDTRSVAEKADALFEMWTKNGNFSGSVLIVQGDTTILEKGYGFADRETGAPNTPETLFHISGLGEGFVAVAILQLQEQGKLTVQDKICDYLSECPDTWREITLHHLLSHTSGIPDPTASSPTVDQIIAAAQELPLTFQSGSGCSPNSLDYILLTKTIDTVAGTSYRSLLKTTVFDPLEMTHTGWDARAEEVALGYQHAGDTLVEPADDPTLFAMTSTLDDLRRWNDGLQSNQLISKESQALMFTGYCPVPGWPDWELGYSFSLRTGASPMIEGWGFYSGYAAILHYYFDDRTTIIALMNQGDITPWDVGFRVAERALGK